jgi:hypothetical protein
MTIDLPGWKRKRTTVKSKITRIESFVKAFKDGDDLFQLESRVPHLENAFKEFEEYQDEIEQVEEDDNTREEVEIQYHNTVAKIKNLTSKATSPSASNSHNNIQSSSLIRISRQITSPKFTSVFWFLH